eukprot:g3964.t1
MDERLGVGEPPREPENREQRMQRAKKFAVASSALQQVFAVVAYVSAFFCLLNLRRELLAAQQDDHTFDFSATNWRSVFLPVWVSGGLRLLPLILAARCEERWVDAEIPRPRTGADSGRAALHLATPCQAALNCVAWLWFATNVYSKLTSSPDMEIKRVFDPFYIRWAATFGLRYWLSYACADPQRRGAPQNVHARVLEEQPVNKALHFSINANMPLFLLWIPMQQKLDGEWDVGWPSTVFSVWFLLAVLNAALAFWVLYCVLAAVGVLRDPHNNVRDNLCKGLAFAAAAACLIALPTYALARLTKRLDGDMSIGADSFMLPLSVVTGAVAFGIAPCIAPVVVQQRRRNPQIDGGREEGGGVSALRRLQQPRHVITDHSGTPTRMRRVNSSLFRILSSSDRGSVDGDDGIGVGGVEVVVEGHVAAGSGAGAGAGDGGGAEDATCVVCFEVQRDAVLVPCGHASVCMDCARKIAEKNGKCPICRANITQALRMGEQVRRGDGTVEITSTSGFTIQRASSRQQMTLL